MDRSGLHGTYQLAHLYKMATNMYKGKDSVCIFSYNSRGFSQEQQDLCKMLMINSEKYFPIFRARETKF